VKLPTILTSLFLAAITAGAQTRLQIVSPTPYQGLFEGSPIFEYIQPTSSGDVESGLFGCVRSGGRQFHEGLDIKPVRPRSRGEPTDEIYAAMDGVVRHIAPQAGGSSYGRYIVLEHPQATPVCYTLYAHLSALRSGLRAGQTVRAGEQIAVMGHTAGGYSIPRSRAHLHFEIGLKTTDDFQPWYNRQKFGSPNLHGNWNGMNLMGFDPSEFIKLYAAHQVNDFGDYIGRLPVAVKVRVSVGRKPDYATRYPSLVKGSLPMGSLISGWEIDCYWTGLPLALRPLSSTDLAGQPPGTIRIIDFDRQQAATHRGIVLVLTRGKTQEGTKQLREVLEKMFGPLR
jgi:murein DD-endopeptidase MepM/ murein hydrolase activator NlpD